MIPEAPEQRWWSATATCRLLRCLAFAAPASAPSRPIGQTADNPGAMAHLALQRGIEAEELSLAHPGKRLQDRFDEVAKAYESEPASMPQGIVTRARLQTEDRPFQRFSPIPALSRKARCSWVTMIGASSAFSTSCLSKLASRRIVPPHPSGERAITF